MEIRYLGVLLRDERESDIGDEIRWNTVQTEWALWDAPWEMEEELRSFDPEEYRRKTLERLTRPLPDHRRVFELDTDTGVHIGSVSMYCIDENYSWVEKAPRGDAALRAARWAVGIEICEPSYWSGGWGTRALAAFIKYHLGAGYEELYTQTWSGNVRMVGLAEKLGFREVRREAGIRQVRGGTYDGLTFRLDREAFEALCRELEKETAPDLELYVPRVEDMWFVQRMQEDPATMSYNAGWDVSFEGYHPDTGCIDFPEERWARKHAGLVGREPEAFWALVRERSCGGFVGEVNFHPGASPGIREIGVVICAPYRNRGYGRAALELLCRKAFAECGVSALHNDFETGRDPGLAIHLAVGFRQTGTGRAVRFGESTELLELELTAEAWREKHRME